MGEAYGIPYSTLLFRRSSGWKLKRILTTPAHSDKNVDHTGKRYPTMRAMAEAYGITYSLLYNRLKHGWDLEKALTVPRGGRLYGNQGGYRDHLGNTYPTKTAMANAYGIPANVFGARETQHWDLERALTTPVGGNPEAQKKYTDHKGNSFPSLKAMADAYGIPDPTFRQRLRSGYSMKEALTTPVNRNHKRKKK